MTEKQRKDYNDDETKFFNMITGMMYKHRNDYNDDEKDFFRFFITQCWIGQLSGFFSGYGNEPYYLFKCNYIDDDIKKTSQGATFQHNVILENLTDSRRLVM